MRFEIICEYFNPPQERDVLKVFPFNGLLPAAKKLARKLAKEFDDSGMVVDQVRIENLDEQVLWRLN